MSALPVAMDDRSPVEGKPEWHSRARCRSANFDPTDFFLEGLFQRNSAPYFRARDRAISICDGCDTRVECLQYALDHDERDGIWGGLTAAGRRQLLWPKARAGERVQP